jgi:hypothetical protein
MAHEQNEKLTIAAGEWGPDADRLIAQALTHATVADIRHQVEHQGARLFFVEHSGKRAGAFVLRVDQTPSGAEGVIVAGAGHIDGVDMMGTCMPHIETLFKNCVAIRYHTARAALARRLLALGYEPVEIVCKKRMETKNELLAA